MTAGDATNAPILLGGCPRSGLTLLRLMLDAHPQISCGPDSGALSLARAARDFRATLGDLHARDFALPPARVAANIASAIHAILDARRVALGKTRWAEKSPLNILFFEDYAAMFPEARFIHVVRDGRDVAASLLARAWRDPRSGRVLPQCATAGGAALYWQGLASLGVAAERALGSRALRVRYEDLAETPQAVLARLCAFINAPLEAGMMRIERGVGDLVGLERESAADFNQPIDGRFVGRFGRDLSAAQIAEVEAIASEGLTALGYR